MFKHRVNGASRDRVYRASSACVACPDGSPLIQSLGSQPTSLKSILILSSHLQCVWLTLSRKFSSSPAGWKLRVCRQAILAGGGVFTEVNWLKLRYILHIMILCMCCTCKYVPLMDICLPLLHNN